MKLIWNPLLGILKPLGNLHFSNPVKTDGLRGCKASMQKPLGMPDWIPGPAPKRRL